MARRACVGIAAAALLSSAPAVGADAIDVEAECHSCPQQVASLDARLASVESTLRRLDEGSGAAEAASASGGDKADEQRNADEQRFLHEVWTDP